MQLRDFLSRRVGAHELCVVREDGYIVATVWVDYEDLFFRSMDRYFGYHEVKTHEWGELSILKPHCGEIKIPCHYIDI